MGGGRKFLRGFAIAYAVAGLLALLVVPASVAGIAGIEPDPLSGIFALLLALPWSLVLHFFDDIGTWGTLAICAGGILLNLLILWRFSRPKSGA